MNVSGYREYQRGLHDRGSVRDRPSILLLGPKRGLLAASVTAVGLLTFFMPWISTDPPAMGLSEWSLWSVARGVQDGTLPGTPNQSFILVLGFLYAIMLVNLIGLCLSALFSVPKIQATIALIGGWVCCEAKYSYFGQKVWKLERLFYGNSSGGHVGLDRLLTALIVIMAALCLISLDAMLDPEAPRDKMRVPLE
jgi:hypothetical protein